MIMNQVATAAVATITRQVVVEKNLHHHIHTIIVAAAAVVIIRVDENVTAEVVTTNETETGNESEIGIEIDAVMMINEKRATHRHLMSSLDRRVNHQVTLTM